MSNAGSHDSASSDKSQCVERVGGAGDRAASLRQRSGAHALPRWREQSGPWPSRALTEASIDDATPGITLIEAVDGTLGRMTADAAYDTIDFYEAGARGTTVVVPWTSTANVSRHGLRSSARDHTVVAVKEMVRRRWKRIAGQLRFMQQCRRCGRKVEVVT